MENQGKICCHHCSSPKFLVIGTNTADRSPQETVICKKCSLIYRIHPEFHTYDSKLHYKEYSPDQDRLEDDIQMGKRILHWIREESSKLELVFKLDSSSRTLDIGSGIGGVLKEIRDISGCEVHGVEPSTSFSEYSREKLGIKMIGGNFEDTHLQGKYDLIILSHVVFHFLKPLDCLARLREHLSPSGVCYIATGNYFSPKRFGGLNQYLFKDGKLFYFLPHAMQYALEESGLCIVAYDTERPNPNHGQINYLAVHKELAQSLDLEPISFREVGWRETALRLKIFDVKSKLLYLKKEGLRSAFLYYLRNR